MSKTNIFISDLDNTLFEACTNNISEEDCAAIVKWKETGNKFWVATGRGPDTVDMLADKGITPDTLIFSAGGGYRIGCNPPVYRGAIANSVAARVFDLLNNMFSDICYFLDVSGTEERYVDGPEHLWLDHFHSSQMPPHVSAREYLVHSLDTRLMRIFCVAPSEEYLAKLKEAVEDRFHGILLCLHNDANCADIIPASNTKWFAVQETLQKQGFVPGQCAAIGDDEADATMIMGCGIGFAMECGAEKAKASADYIVPSVADALWLLEHQSL